MSQGRGRLDRREFMLGTLAALALPGLVIPAAARPAAGNASAGKTVLAVVEDVDPFQATVRAVGFLGGMNAFVPVGSRVLVKPNIGWDRRVEQAADTHPEVVRAVVEMCLESGAGDVVILDRTCNDARRTYVTSGIRGMVDALASKQVHLEYVRENRFTMVKIPRGVAIKQWPIYSYALEVDVIINVPVAKHHSISGLTLSMKNLMGLMGGNRGTIHSNIGQKLADVSTVIRPALNILDASRILLRNGPSGGRMEDVKVLNRVAACADPVALDAYGATLFGIRADRIPSIVAGYSMGLGEIDLSRVKMAGT